MAADVGSLHAILKDPTRRQILAVLADRGPLAYVEILNLLEIEHTGKLNYHLKQLGDLISKDESGRYALTEKGRLAGQVMAKFQPPPGENNLLSGATQWALAGAVAFFAAGAVYLSLEVVDVFISAQFSLSLWTLTLVLPFVLGVVTLLKVWRPLQNRDANARIRRWAVPLAILGIPCGLGAAFVLLIGVDDKVSKSQKR
jgi:hypothetical protein